MKLTKPLILAIVILFALAACNNGGDGDSSNSDPLPQSLPDFQPTTFSAGYGSAALVNDVGALRTWGDNQYHQLGDLSRTNQDIPIVIPPPDLETLWRTVAVGGYHMLAIARNDLDRTLWGWGLNAMGQAGHWYTADDVVQPVQIGSDTDWSVIAAGLYHSLAIKTEGTLWAWGHNFYGQLGCPATTFSSIPLRVGSASFWSSVSAGHYHTLAIEGDTDLYAWGRNTWGQCGNGEDGNQLDDAVYLGRGWKQVSAGYTQSAAVRHDGTLWAWGGSGMYAYLGNGTSVGSNVPVQVGTDSDWEMVSVGGTGYFTLALKQNGSLWAWGQGIKGQLGDGTYTGEVLSPVEVQPGTVWTDIAAGNEFGLGMKGDILYSWGNNQYGELGVGGNDRSNVPVKVDLY